MSDPEELRALMRKSRQRALMRPMAVIPEQERKLNALERKATDIRLWSPHIVPGLLQTEPYIRAVVKASVLTKPEDVELVVAARLRHQQVVLPERQHTFFIQEHALDLPVGGPGAMDEQRAHLLTMSELEHVSIRIVPMGVVGGFRLLRFPDAKPVVYVDSLNAMIFLDDDHSVTTYERVAEKLDETALDEDESRERISRRGSAS
jgi:hypothetical protein